MKDSERGDVRVVGQPIVMSRTPASVVSGIPEQGEHTQDILKEFGYSDTEIAQLRDRKIVCGRTDQDHRDHVRRTFSSDAACLTTDDGVKLHYEEAGSGTPIVFVHEFAGDCRSWEAQMRYFGRRYRCIAFNARGYPPSDVPDNVAKYSQERARDDIKAVLDALKLDKAHIVGLSMGGFATLHFGFTYPQRALSLVVAGCGYGASGDKSAQFAAEVEAAAARFEQLGMDKAAEGYASAPSRVQFQNKDPRGWREFADQLAGNSTRGAALTMRGVQSAPPVAVRSGRADESDHGADPGGVRRRGLAVPRARHPDEAHDPDRRPRRHAELRPHDEPGGAGRIQPASSPTSCTRWKPAVGRRATRGPWSARSSASSGTTSAFAAYKAEIMAEMKIAHAG